MDVVYLTSPTLILLFTISCQHIACTDSVIIELFGLPLKFSLSFCYFQVTYLEPGESSDIETNYGSKISVKATAGPVLGPPWQRPENG